MNQPKRRIAILCGGGPAPGMNSVISAATIEARKSDWEVLGIRNGFRHLIEGDPEQVEVLSIMDVSRIHLLGGSIIYTSRANPTVRDEGAADPEWRLNRSVETLRKLGVDALITIGGEDTAYSAMRVAQAGGGRIHVAHVPKTIDNDLPLPGGMPTFGYQTARHVGVEIVNNLMTDAMTTGRWYFLVAMGRSAGHLGLGIGKAASATVTIIAEEFPRNRPIRLEQIVDILETAMLKRQALGRPFGVAIVAEGISLRLDPKEIEQMVPEDVERDDHGHIRLAELHIHRLLATLVKKRFTARSKKITIVSKNIGYELRCAAPIPFDIDYTRDLGHGAVEYLRKLQRSGSTEIGAMMTLSDGVLRPLPFGSFNDPATGRVMVREVNVSSEWYRVARKYMIRLEPEDLQHPERLQPIATAAGMSPDEFQARYSYIFQQTTVRPEED